MSKVKSQKSKVKQCLASLILWLLPASGFAAVLDRIAVTVGNDAITEGEVLEEIRVTALLNNEPLDFGPQSRHAAADRLVDQYLIRHELETGIYPKPDSKHVAQVLQDFEKAHFRSHAEFEQKVKQYGVTADEVKAHLLFQLAAIQFTDLRFNLGVRNEADRVAPAAAPPAAAKPAAWTARPAPIATPQRTPAAPSTTGTVDEQLDSWLKQLRSQTRIEFKKGAFE